MSDSIYKVTLYMSPEQWNEMSQLNVETGKPSWKGLYHEIDKQDEYRKFLESFKIKPIEEEREETLKTVCPEISKIKKFDPQTTIWSHALIIGKRATGKTFLVHDLLKTKNIHNGLIINQNMCDYDTEFFQNAEKHEEFQIPILDKFLENQRKELKHRVREDTNKYIVLDDCIYTQMTQYLKNPSFRDLIMNTRHYNLTLIHTQSFAIFTPPEYRTNLDCVFIFRDENISNRKRLYELYGGIFTTFDIFSQYMSQLTIDSYDCMVIYNNIKTNNIYDSVFWYRASY